MRCRPASGDGVTQADWVNNYDATYGPGNPSATSQAVVGTRLDNPVRAATRANATYREQERAWGHSQRSPNSRPPTPTQATVGAVATGLVVFGIGCALRVCGQGTVVATQLAVHLSCSNGGYCPPGWAQDTLSIAGMIIGGPKPRLTKTSTAAGAAARAPSVIEVGGLKLPGVPRGLTGTPTRSGKGLEYRIPRGTPELDPRVASIRVMDPVTTGKYHYRNGYVTYMNSGGQAVNPLTGRTLQPSDPLWHIPLP